MGFVPENVDLRVLAEGLCTCFGSNLPTGHVRARTAFRDAVAAALPCSAAEAERLVDTMIARGFLRPSHDPSTSMAADIRWMIDPSGGTGSG